VGLPPARAPCTSFLIIRAKLFFAGSMTMEILLGDGGNPNLDSLLDSLLGFPLLASAVCQGHSVYYL
jgi:hypothetical protein